MPLSPHNPNLRRKLLPGLLMAAAALALRPLLLPLRIRRPKRPELTVFASYMVGDLYMALPALKKLAAARPVKILCRPGCVGLLAAEGLEAEAFPNPALERGLRGVPQTLKAALALRRASRGEAGDALDLDADPRTALWMRVAGLRAISYRRAFGLLFHETFPLPEPSRHQADRDLRVVEAYLRRYPSANPADAPANAADGPSGSSSTNPRDAADAALEPSSPRSAAPWIFSVWTRKPSKNWALENWDALLERALAAGIAVQVLEPPDGDAAFRAFRARWRERARTGAPAPRFFKGGLEEVARAVRDAAGVVATDNFLGHMAGYHGKPVLWINRVSPSSQVKPRGPRTVEVASDAPSRPDRPTIDAAWDAFRGLL